MLAQQHQAVSQLSFMQAAHAAPFNCQWSQLRSPCYARSTMRPCTRPPSRPPTVDLCTYILCPRFLLPPSTSPAHLMSQLAALSCNYLQL